jgi:hypothetical protein
LKFDFGSKPAEFIIGQTFQAALQVLQRIHIRLPFGNQAGNTMRIKMLPRPFKTAFCEGKAKGRFFPDLAECRLFSKDSTEWQSSSAWLLSH